MRKTILRSVTTLIVSVILAVTYANGQSDENFDSPAPQLLTEGGSNRVVAIDPELFRGVVPKTASGDFKPGARLMVFVRGISVPADEGARGLRVYGESLDGRTYRLVSESLVPLRRSVDTYGLIISLRDENGFYGQPTDGNMAIRVVWRGNTSEKAVLGGGPFTADKLKLPETGFSSFASTGGDRGRFMQQATFGPNSALDFRLRQIGIRRWITEQFAKPYPTVPYPNMPLKPFDGPNSCGIYDTNQDVNLCHRYHYWNYLNQRWMMQEAFYGDDQLRRRVSWALHQIWVVSHNNISQQRGTQEYIEILDRNAFGNYRTLMQEMTLSPAMGEFLDMVRSTRQNPNENYARELLQLFSVGLYMLNPDGTLKTDGSGNPIPTYDQAKVEQFTKVFTGWTQCNSGNDPRCSNAVIGINNYIDPMILQFPSNHDTTAKSLFDYPGAPNPTIAACTNCTNDTARVAYANDSLNKTLDNIFNHPNVGTYIGKILIQHLVTSDPSPAYVARVTAAFNNNGSGVRGDMKAVISAVLLDPEARGSRKTDPNYGKLRDPLLYMTSYLRTFNVAAGVNAGGVGTATPPAECGGRSDGVMGWMTEEMGQDIWAPPSVFSYFPPEYVVPGTSVLGPEFALANTGSSFARNNHIFSITFWGGIWFSRPTATDLYPWVPCGTSVNFSEPTAWAAADPTGNTLIEGLNNKMMYGTMSEAMKTKIRTAINFNVSAEAKAQQAIFLITTSSQYQIQR